MHTLSRKGVLAPQSTLALLFLLTGNNALAQVATFTLSDPALSTPIPLWAVGSLILMLAILGYCALRTRLPVHLNRLRGWTIMAVLSLAAIASGIWPSRAYAPVASIFLNGIVTVTGALSTGVDYPVINNMGRAMMITGLSLDVGTFATPFGSPPTAQCAIGLTLAPSGQCLIRVAAGCDAPANLRRKTC